MHFNTDKCKVLHIGKSNSLHKYSINNIQIDTCSSEKDLGVFFDNKLIFDNHINYAVNKANLMLGLIKRSFLYLDIDSFLCLYKSLVRPHLEYGNIIWYPLFKRQSAMLERVQRRATKMLIELNDLSYQDRLKRLHLPPLKARRFRGDLIQTYKIMSNIDNINFTKFFQVNYTAKTRNVHKFFLFNTVVLTSVNIRLVIVLFHYGTVLLMKLLMLLILTL